MSNRTREPFYIKDADTSASVTGKWVQLEHRDNVGVQAKWADGVIGTFLVEVSNDERDPAGGYQASPAPSGRLGPAPLTLPDSMTVPAAVPAGTAGTFFFDFNQVSALWFRFSFVAGEGSAGELNAGLSAKGI